MQPNLQKALDEISQLESGEKFLVKDLFKGYEWRRLPIRDKLELVKSFCEEAQNPYLKSREIVALDKTSAVRQMFRKK